MSLPKENTRLARFIHEEIHEIARDKELLEPMRDFVSIIITKWEDWKDKNIGGSPYGKNSKRRK